MKIGDEITRKKDGKRGRIVGFEGETKHHKPIIVKWFSDEPCTRVLGADHVSADEINVEKANDC